MKRPIALILSILFVLTMVTISMAGSGAKMRQAMEGMGGKEIQGEVTTVNAKEKMITVKGMRGLITATCDEKTFVKMGNVTKTCADIKVGDKANMLFEPGEGKNVAKSIFLSVPAAPAPAKAPEEKKAEPPKAAPSPEEKKSEPAKTETK